MAVARLLLNVQYASSNNKVPVLVMAVVVCVNDLCRHEDWNGCSWGLSRIRIVRQCRRVLLIERLIDVVVE